MFSTCYDTYMNTHSFSFLLSFMWLLAVNGDARRKIHSGAFALSTAEHKCQLGLNLIMIVIITIISGVGILSTQSWTSTGRDCFTSTTTCAPSSFRSTPPPPLPPGKKSKKQTTHHLDLIQLRLSTLDTKGPSGLPLTNKFA